MSDRVRLPLLFLLLAASAGGFVRSITSGGVPLKRVDAENIQFLVNNQTRPGLTNADGELLITEDSDPIAALQAALDTWNGVQSSLVNFVPLQTTPRELSADGQHVFMFVDTPEIRSVVEGTVTIAVMCSRFSPASGLISDTDIYFNPNFISPATGERVPFSTTQAAGTFDIQSVATHELGHALGANHSQVRASSMYPRTGQAKTTQSSVTDDDAAFLTSVYPAPGALNNVGSISGSVRLPGGGPATGVLVTAVDPNTGVTVGTITDLDDGSYAIDAIPPGGYYVTVEAANGPFLPGDLKQLNQAKFNTNVRDTFLGGNDSPSRVDVVAGGSATADITVQEGPLARNIAFLESAPAGEFPNLFGVGVANLPPGETHDILLGGPGIDASITIDDIRLLAPGVTVQQVTLLNNIMVGPHRLLRIRVDVASAPGAFAARNLSPEPAFAAPFDGRAVGTLAIVKEGEALLYTGGVVIQGAAAVPRPEVFEDFVLNAATGALAGEPGHAVSLGSIISLFGTRVASASPGTEVSVKAPSIPLPTSLGGVSVTFNGIPAPLFGVFGTPGFDQVNAQLPWEVGAGAATVVVTRDGVSSAPLQIQVAPTSPGIFAFSGQGTGPAVVQNFSLGNDDVIPESFAQPAGFFGDLVGQPAAVGGVIIIFANGLGEVVGARVTGDAPGVARNTQKQVTVLIGGAEANIIAAPVLHATLVGLNQINAFVPDVPPGDAVPIQLEVDGITSRAEATIAVRGAP